MVNVITEINIDRSIGEVSEYAVNPDNATSWYKNIQAAKWITPKPLGVGSKIAFEAMFMGRKLEYTYEIKEFLPGRKLVMATSEGPFPMETTYKWEAINEKTTRMTLQNKGEPSGFSRVFAFMMSRMMRKANQKDLRLIKTILESH